MSVTAAHLRELTALGIAGETLIRVVEIIYEVSALSADKSADVRRGPLESTADENRKERDKIRKRLARAAEKSARTTPETSADTSTLSADSPLSDSVVSLTCLPSEEGFQGSKKEGSRVRARGVRLSPGALLSDEHRAIILAEGIHDPEKLWAEFVDYWSDIPGQRGVKISWSGTLRNRCKDVIKRGFNGNATGANRANQATGQSGSAAIMAGVAAAAERRGRERSAGGPEPRRQPPRDADTASEPDFEFGRASDG